MRCFLPWLVDVSAGTVVSCRSSLNVQESEVKGQCHCVHYLQTKSGPRPPESLCMVCTDMIQSISCRAGSTIKQPARPSAQGTLAMASLLVANAGSRFHSINPRRHRGISTTQGPDEKRGFPPEQRAPEKASSQVQQRHGWYGWCHNDLCLAEKRADPSNHVAHTTTPGTSLSLSLASLLTVSYGGCSKAPGCDTDAGVDDGPSHC